MQDKTAFDPQPFSDRIQSQFRRSKVPRVMQDLDFGVEALAYPCLESAQHRSFDNLTR